MAIVVTDNRIVVDKFDVATNLSSPIGGEGLNQFTSDPDPKDLSAHYGMAISTEEGEIIATITGVDLSSGVLVYVWVLPLGTMDSVANYGVSIVLGNGTDTRAYQMAGGSVVGFRHESGQPSYQCLLIDTGNLPTSKPLRGGALSLTSVSEFGANYVTLSKALGGSSNCFTDVIRYGNGGLTITGTDSASYLLFDLAALDASNTSGQAYGICRNLGGGVFGLQGQILLGDTGSGTDTLRIIDQTLKFENFFGVGTNKFGLTVQGGTGTQTITFTNSNFLVPLGVGAFFLATDIDVENLDVTGCLFKNWDQGFDLSADATNAPNWDWSNNNFVGCSQINVGKTAFKDNTIDSTVDANGGMIIDANTSLTNVSGLKFISDGTGHAIYITATGTHTLSNYSYTGYGANDTTDAVVYNNSGGAVTLDVVGGDTPTVRNGTGASTTVNASYNLEFTGLIAGSEVRCYTGVSSDAENAVEIGGIESSGTTFSFSHNSGGVAGYILILSVIYNNIAIDPFTYSSADQSIPIQQTIDRDYLNPP